MKRVSGLCVCTAFAAGLLSPLAASAASVNVAVAANFTDAAKEIATAFKAKTGDEAILSFGSSGQFYTQIKQGAPFQILLSADQDRAKKLAGEGEADKASEFTYAVGKLVLWSKTADYVKGEETLKGGLFAKISIADPAAAPYGTAAIETMKALGLYDALKPKVVQGASIAQAYQFVATGNAEVGFVALSQVMKPGGSRWMVPQNLYTPIKQDAIILKNGASDPTAKEFMAFLKGPAATATIKKFGYVVGTAG
jgi:molybdate transport system substrate-binding protein